MAGEISTAGIRILYAPETSLNTCPSSGFKEKATSGNLKINEYVTGISGLGADYDMYDVTPLAETKRHRFIKGLQNNDGSISFNANINPTSRDDWGKIVTEFAALTDGKSLWWEIILPGDSQGFFFRGEPLEMRFPDVEVGQAVQGAVQIVENNCIGFSTKIDVASA
jgi:hypothetical protein